MTSNLYEYLDYRQFLKNWFADAKKRNPRFSHRDFARQSNITTPNFLQMVLQRKLNLNSSTLCKVAAGIGLTKRQEQYFEALVGYDQAKTFPERDKYYQRMLRLKKASPQTVLHRSQYAYYSAWHHSALRALLGYVKFNPRKDDFASLGKMLYPNITASQVRKSINLLEKLDLVKKNTCGDYVQSTPSISTGAGKKSVEIVKHQMDVINLAKAALNDLPVECRDVSTLTLNISAKGFEAIRDKIGAMRKEIIQIACKDDLDDRVYQLNIQLFPLTNPKKERQKRA